MNLTTAHQRWYPNRIDGRGMEGRHRLILLDCFLNDEPPPSHQKRLKNSSVHIRATDTHTSSAITAQRLNNTSAVRAQKAFDIAKLRGVIHQKRLSAEEFGERLVCPPFIIEQFKTVFIVHLVVECVSHFVGNELFTARGIQVLQVVPKIFFIHKAESMKRIDHVENKTPLLVIWKTIAAEFA